MIGYFLLFILNLAFPLVVIAVLVFFLISPRRGLLKNLKQEVWERFAVKGIGQIHQKPIWIHAASVGEVKSVIKFANDYKILMRRPVIITTDTAAGKAAALKDLAFDKALLAPVDCYPVIKRFIKIYKPQSLFIVESDLWPNMIVAAANNNIPVSIINGRLSQRSAKRYSLLSPLVKLILEKISIICVQTKQVYDTYLSVGANPSKLHITGNIKYDMLNDQPARRDEALQNMETLGWGKDTPIITCGSTHEEEEALIIETAKKLKNVKFIIAPRHLERKKQIHNALAQSGLNFAVLSQIKKSGKNTQILLADSMGRLSGLYSIADICFVGGSIAKCGGHNFLEAAILEKPVIFGPYFYNTPDVAVKLLDGGGAKPADKNNFSIIIGNLLSDKNALAEMARNAKAVAESFKGATEKTINTVKKL